MIALTTVGLNDTTVSLRVLAEGLAESYGAHAQPRAILLVGSAATGDADMYSDLDLLIYHRQVPLGDEVARTARELGRRGIPGHGLD